jgi:hypothetical protein
MPRPAASANPSSEDGTTSGGINNRHGRRLGPRGGTPMHVMAAHALARLPGREGNLTQISAVIQAVPAFAGDLDWSPRPGTKTYPRWKDALVGCFKAGRYPHLVKSDRRLDGLNVYRLVGQAPAPRAGGRAAAAVAAAGAADVEAGAAAAAAAAVAAAGGGRGGGGGGAAAATAAAAAAAARSAAATAAADATTAPAAKAKAVPASRAVEVTAVTAGATAQPTPPLFLVTKASAGSGGQMTNLTAWAP